MFVNYRTQGLILKKEDRGEADRLFTIYTKDFGKLKILAKAVRKISSKLRVGAEIFYLSEVEFIQGKSRKTLTCAIPIEKFRNLRHDLKRLKIAYQIAELTDNFILEPEQDERIWNLLMSVFKKINDLKFSENNLQSICHYFLFHFVAFLGYQINAKDFNKAKHILA